MADCVHSVREYGCEWMFRIYVGKVFKWKLMHEILVDKSHIAGHEIK